MVILFITIITIAHRLNTVVDYDRVLVLKDGVIAELDSPRTLMQTEGSIFRGMCQVQTYLTSEKIKNQDNDKYILFLQDAGLA